MNNLYQHSIDVIRRSQAASGAYLASPNFSSYAYCWLRDGSFIAHAMDRVGEHASAHAFFRWAAHTIEQHAEKAERALALAAAGQPLGSDDYLPTRYTVDGRGAGEQWWDFQLDGYGTWLWAAAEHIRRADDSALAGELAESAALIVRYLSGLWRLPNYDLWEEHASYLHTYTLAAIYGGLNAAETLAVGVPAEVLSQIRQLVLSEGVVRGEDGAYLAKSFAPEGGLETALAKETPAFHDSGEANAITAAVDASLLGVSTPYRLLAPEHPLMQATLNCIEETLHRPGGGVYRYRGDSYYGGGEWVLLAAWLGWHYAQAGERERARALMHWVEAQADEKGNLAEQISDHLLAPGRYQEWEQRWGVVASPLAWSHAMYLILSETLRE